MSQPRQRRRLSIFARTFLLLAVALVLAQGIGVSLLVMRTPVFSTPVHPPEIVALLSTQMPAASENVQVADSATLPEPPKDQQRDPRAEAMMARWMGLDADRVRFFRGGGIPAMAPDGMPPPDAFSHRPPDQPGAGDNGAPMLGPPPARDPGLPADAMAERGWHPEFGPGFNPGSPQMDAFTAAVQQPNGHWRVVSSNGRKLSAAFKWQVGALFAIGLLMMLPLSWWFSRALSSPIRQFSEAADLLGRNPNAPPLERRGPSEIVQAADSFNTMQARLNRMVHERTQMVAAIAHDLRTPLARLAFRLESVPTPLREKTQADIDEMKAMITAALDFIRNERRLGARSQIDFQLLVEGVVDDLTDTGANAQLIEGQTATVDGDPIALRRMVVNLMENAIKYGKRARAQVRREGAHCVLWVDDDGPGIDMSQREQLLLPFVRGETSRNRDTGGIGLGLAVAQSIALAHGGDLQLDNRVEGGLRASVRLPCTDAPA